MRLLYFVPALLYMALIFVLSSTLPPPELQDWPSWQEIDLIHVIEYGGLGSLMMFGMLRGTSMCTSRCALYAAAVSIAYGISDEWHQMYVPQRVPSAGDVIADAIGASLAVAVYYFALRWTWLPAWLKPTP